MWHILHVLPSSGQGSLLCGSSWRFLFVFVHFFIPPLVQRSKGRGCYICTDCESSLRQIIICNFGLYKQNLIDWLIDWWTTSGTIRVSWYKASSGVLFGPPNYIKVQTSFKKTLVFGPITCTKFFSFGKPADSHPMPILTMLGWLQLVVFWYQSVIPVLPSTGL